MHVVLDKPVLTYTYHCLFLFSIVEFLYLCVEPLHFIRKKSYVFFSNRHVVWSMGEQLLCPLVLLLPQLLLVYLLVCLLWVSACLQRQWLVSHFCLDGIYTFTHLFSCKSCSLSICFKRYYTWNVGKRTLFSPWLSWYSQFSPSIIGASIISAFVIFEEWLFLPAPVNYSC